MYLTKRRDTALTSARLAGIGARAAGLALAGLLLTACASIMPPEMTAPVTTAPVDAPTFGAPKQIGDRPVMDAASQTKMQADLETLAKQRESDAVKEIEAGQ